MGNSCLRWGPFFIPHSTFHSVWLSTVQKSFWQIHILTTKKFGDVLAKKSYAFEQPTPRSSWSWWRKWTAHRFGNSNRSYSNQSVHHVKQQTGTHDLLSLYSFASEVSSSTQYCPLRVVLFCMPRPESNVAIQALITRRAVMPVIVVGE
jgi:hypothetical protein